MHVLRENAGPSEVLLVHAPYPGKLKFPGVPSSLFSAIGPFVSANGPAPVSYLDPVAPSDGFYRRLEGVLAGGTVRVLCVSTSTAAIEECARVAEAAARVSPGTLVVVGGPHEDAVEAKAADVLPGVHLSIAVSVRAEGAHAVEAAVSLGILAPCNETHSGSALSGATTWRPGIALCSSARPRAG